MKSFKDNHPDHNHHESQKDRRILSKLHERLRNLRHKVSRGAASIFNAMKTRTKWGNKQLFKGGDKGHQHRDKK